MLRKVSWGQHGFAGKVWRKYDAHHGSGLLASHLFHNRLEMDVQRLEADKHTVRAGENHIVLVVPAASGAQMHLVLLALGFAKNIQGGYSQGDSAFFSGVYIILPLSGPDAMRTNWR